MKKSEWSVSTTPARPDPLLHARSRRPLARARDRNLARKAVRELELKKVDQGVTVTAENLDKYAGVRKFRFGEADLEDQVGVVTGLAWTEVGGELLTIEAVPDAGQGQA
jgi:ATP-dependent Lon protease